MKNLFARANRWYPDPTTNPIRRLARRAFRESKVEEYRTAVLARLQSETDNQRAIASTLALFDNVIKSAEWKSQNAKPKPETKIKRIRREWREAV